MAYKDVMNLKVNEIFYSLQGEGMRVGRASIFIRLAGCNLHCPFCDTSFTRFTLMSVNEILDEIERYHCRCIVWTGGEPALQLTDEIVAFFKQRGYFQAIETNGTLFLPTGLDYISCSPKGSLQGLRERIPKVDELRFPIRCGDVLPEANLLPEADCLMVSPVFDGERAVKENINYCISLVKANPEWILSVQMHKLIGIR